MKDRRPGETVEEFTQRAMLANECANMMTAYAIAFEKLAAVVAKMEEVENA